MTPSLNSASRFDDKPEEYVTRDEFAHLTTCFHELSLQIAKNSAIQEEIVKKLDEFRDSILSVQKDNMKINAAWNLIANLWQKAPKVCIGIFLTMFLMTDGSVHMSSLITKYYKLINDNEDVNGGFSTSNQNSPSA